MINEKNNEYYVARIKSDIEFIILHMKDVSLRELSENEVLQDSMMFRLVQISENSGKLSDGYKAERPEIPWKDISGLRNRIIHDYGNVDLRIVYDTLSSDIPELKRLFDKTVE